MAAAVEEEAEEAEEAGGAPARPAVPRRNGSSGGIREIETSGTEIAIWSCGGRDSKADGCGQWAVGCGLWAVGCGLWAVGCLGCEPRTEGWGCEPGDGRLGVPGGLTCSWRSSECDILLGRSRSAAACARAATRGVKEPSAACARAATRGRSHQPSACCGQS